MKYLLHIRYRAWGTIWPGPQGATAQEILRELEDRMHDHTLNRNVKSWTIMPLEN